MDPLPSRPGVCDVAVVRGSLARADAAPDLLLEVAHGATRAADFTALAAQLRVPPPADLIEFFFVNTDVGAPEVAAAVAQEIVQRQPRRTALVVTCRLPRTLVDCNRRIDAATRPISTPAGAMTPGLPPWIQDEADRQFLLGRYGEYRAVVEAAFDRVCGAGGLALCVHTYAPRSIDVPVDAAIVASLRAEYAADRIGRWPLRAAVDLITADPDGRELAHPQVAQRAEAEFAAAGFEVIRNGAYSLHPSTLAHGFAVQHPGRTLCLEIRRDLLVREFTPFREMEADPERVARIARLLASASLAGLPVR